jgi:hypothetical protein
MTAGDYIFTCFAVYEFTFFFLSIRATSKRKIVLDFVCIVAMLLWFVFLAMLLRAFNYII